MAASLSTVSSVDQFPKGEMVMRPPNGVRLGDQIVDATDNDCVLVIPLSTKDQIWNHYHVLSSDQLCLMFKDLPIDSDAQSRISKAARQLSMFLSDCDFNSFDEKDIGKMAGIFEMWKTNLADEKLSFLSFENDILTTDNAQVVYNSAKSYVERFDNARAGFGLGNKK